VNKPEPIPCSICGEMIEPFYDSGHWCFGSASIVDEKTGKAGGPFHFECMKDARLWKRIRAIEAEIDRMSDDGD